MKHLFLVLYPLEILEKNMSSVELNLERFIHSEKKSYGRLDFGCIPTGSSSVMSDPLEFRDWC